MPEFRFAIDTQTTIWDRDIYIIERDTEEEAIEFMKKYFNDEIPIEDQPIVQESITLDDSIDYKEPTYCNPEKTKELLLLDEFDEDKKCILNNAIPPTQNPHV